MTLALTATSTPIFDELLTEVIAADELDAHFASIPVDKAPVVIDVEIVDITDTTPASAADGDSVDDTNDSDDLDAHFAAVPTDRAPASATTPEDTTSVHRHRAAWFLWLILAVGVTIGAVIWLTAPAAVAVI